MELTEHFDKYAEYGFRVIPLIERGKTPVYKRWNKFWDQQKCRRAFENIPNLNIGILLGELVDVEGDTPQANARIDELIGNLPHPCYSSAKSVHHLFRNPYKRITRIVFNGIEFRGYHHQSVLPPSIHESGAEYKWLDDDLDNIPDLPHSLTSLIPNFHIPKLKPGHVKPWCGVCEKRKFIHKKRYDLEVLAFQRLGLRWQCHQCREIDVRDDVRQIRKALGG